MVARTTLLVGAEVKAPSGKAQSARTTRNANHGRDFCIGLVGSFFNGRIQHTRGGGVAQPARWGRWREEARGVCCSARRVTNGALKCAATKDNVNREEPLLTRRPQDVAGAWLLRLRRYTSGPRRC